MPTSRLTGTGLADEAEPDGLDSTVGPVRTATRLSKETSMSAPFELSVTDALLATTWGCLATGGWS